jgi:S-adenosylmethionine hydrolase
MPRRLSVRRLSVDHREGVGYNVLVMSIITLTTDFGASDGYVGTMKGVILSIAPDVRLVDVTHEIAPQNIRQAAFMLHASAPYFPPGTIHLAVVDPGVGSERRVLIIQTSRGCLVGPDNGLFTLFLADEPEAECRAMTNPAFTLPRVSATFHGRDVFAPVAAHLALRLAHSGARRAEESLAREAGALHFVQGDKLDLAEFGPRVTDPVTWTIPRPTQQPDGAWLGHVLYADHFGNLVTSVTHDLLQCLGDAEISIGGRRIAGIRRTYAQAAPGELVALVGSSGRLEISIVNGNAARTLGLGQDAPFTLRGMQAGLA